MTEKEICEFTQCGTEALFKKRGLQANINYYFNQTGYILKKISTHNYTLEKSPELIAFEKIEVIEGYPKLWCQINVNNLTGKTFGRLKVLYRTNKPITAKTSNHTFWLCQCQNDGNYIVTSSNSLNSGGSTSCGCLRIENRIKSRTQNSNNKYIGQKFGRLLVLERIINNDKITQKFKCQCDCDNRTIIEVNIGNLTTGHTTSCGCVKHQVKDLTNQKFGHLTALKCIGINNKRQAIWKCRCDCKEHTIINVIGIYLTLGYTSSCGCEKNISKGENKIADILKCNNIVFEIQKQFEDCRSQKTNSLLRFDFYLPQENICIEFDGKQHFEPIEFYGGEKEFIKIQQRDQDKNLWCKKNNIPLIRIPYTKLNSLSIEDLMLETSQFRII